MSGRITSDMLLVGSLPVDTTEAAFRYGAELYGDLTFALPDGETGPRAPWVPYDRDTLVRCHPDVVTVAESRRQAGERVHAHNTPLLRLRDDVTEMRFESWPRIDDAIESYGVFCDLRHQGVIPPGLRFQVCLPFPASVVGASFKVAFGHDYAIAGPAFEDLVVREVARLLEHVPAEDLAVQWDVCTEVLDLEGVVAWTEGDPWDRFTGPIRRLAPMVPGDVLMGYHLCYGTAGEWPMFEARDLELVVRMANYATEHSGRSVDWFHLAGPRYFRSEDERFYWPLSGLRVDGARVFLGIVLPIDGVAGLERRRMTACRYLHDFGLAMYCGFGRTPGQDPLQTMREHAEVVRAGLGIGAGARTA